MLDFVLSILALVAGGMMLEIFAAARAPLGYQDEKGFHQGIPVQQRPDASVLSMAARRTARGSRVAHDEAPLQSVSPA